YKIINFTSDSIILTRASKSLYDSGEIEDTFSFVSINKLVKPIDNFKSLRLEMISPFGGNYIITVNYLGAIAYNYESRDILPDDKKEKKKYFGKFSKTELVNFKKTLAESLYWSLPEKRECSGTDPVNSTILITEKNRVFKSTGCGFTYVHGRLISYLLDLDKNPGFIKSKPFKPTKQK
ncbi:MAG TPA: hypothetical protein VHZ50_18480, partial [Puia sp.]|nr:hypothetical protein [Puia sp.]